MKRVKVLFGQRRFQVLVTMAVILLAVSSYVLASGANFTSNATANVGNVFTTGTLSMTNNGSATGAAVTWTSPSVMKPGDSGSATVSIKNTGTVDGNFTLAESNLVAGAGSPMSFAKDLLLTVTDTTTATVVYPQGPLSDFTSANLGTILAGTTHVYQFAVSFPKNGSTNATGDNSFQGTQASCDFNWTAATL